MRKRDSFKVNLKTSHYRVYRNKVVNMIRLAKANYFRDLLVKCQGSASKLWKCMNNFTRPRQTTHPRSLMINNKAITDKLVMANHLNQRFASVATRLAAHMNSSNEVTSYNNNILLNDKFNGVPDTSSYRIPVISVSEVHKGLKELDARKAIGADDIPTKFLQINSKILAKYLQKIINNSFLTCTVPEIWKCAKVTALHKGGDETNIDNYRLISVLCAASKLMECHVYKSLYAYLNDNHLLSPSQSGFVQDIPPRQV